MENTQKRRTLEMQNTGNGEHPEMENAQKCRTPETQNAAEEFRANRDILGMTQQQLADLLGFRRGRRTVSDIERGQWEPSEVVVNLLRLHVAAKIP